MISGFHEEYAVISSQLRSDGMHPQLEAAAIGKLRETIAGFRCAARGIGQSPATAFPYQQERAVPTNLPTVSLDAQGLRRTTPEGQTAETERLLRIFGAYGTPSDDSVVPRGGIEPPTP